MRALQERNLLRAGFRLCCRSPCLEVIDVESGGMLFRFEGEGESERRNETRWTNMRLPSKSTCAQDLAPDLAMYGDVTGALPCAL